MTTTPDLVASTLTRVMHTDRGRILSALASRTGDFQLAEEALQEAGEAALLHWARADIPQNPMAWLIRAAFSKAIDRLRSASRDSRKAAALAVLARDEAEDDPEDIPDERLRLMFTCCHPALDHKSQVALTLRTLGGLTTTEISRAFLDSEATMGQRLSRARAKIATAGIPFAIPGPDLWAERLESLLTVIYLIFNQGCSAATHPEATGPDTLDPDVSGGDQPGVDLCAEAIFLGRILAGLLPQEPEVLGLVSLMLSTHARRPARFDAAGAMVPLDQQDCGRWDREMIAQALAALDHAIVRLAPGPFQIKAAISALHVQAHFHAMTDWQQMILLYDALLRLEPSPVVRLNRAVALAEAGAGGIEAALAELRAIAPQLATYQPFYAALADFLARSGNGDEASAAYGRAIALSATAAERVFLAERRYCLPDGQKKGRA